MSSPPPDPKRAKPSTESHGTAPIVAERLPEDVPTPWEVIPPSNQTRPPVTAAPAPIYPATVYPSAAQSAPPPTPTYPAAASGPAYPPSPANLPPYAYNPAAPAYGYPPSYPGTYPGTPYGYPANYPPAYPGGYPYPASPYGYGAPVYYAPPPLPGQKTTEGLQKLKNATNAAIVFNVIAAVFSLAVLGVLLGPRSASTVALALLLLVVFGLSVIIVGLIILIYGVQGALRLRDGKREFNPDHEQSVDKALRFLIGAVVIYVVGLVVGALVGFAMQTSIGGGPTNPAAQVQVDLVVAVVGGVFNLIFVILIALALEGFIERLMTQKGRAARNLFIGLSLLASFASMGLAVASALFLSGQNAGVGPTVGEAVSLAPLASILSVIALWIYRGQIVRAVEGTRTLIQFGGKDPDATAPAAQAPVPASPPVIATIR